MITEKQKQIIKLLLTNKEGYNVNQIARILNISVSWVHETLKILEKEGILVSVKIANAVFFKLNWENPKTEKICDFILLDTKEVLIAKPAEQKQISTQISQSIQPKPSYQSFYNNQINQFRGYSPISSPMVQNIDNPYRQAIASQSFSPTNYSVAPVGNQGVNTVLSSYAASGAFSNTGYSTATAPSTTQVPPGNLASRVSSNVSGFSMTQHTSTHTNIVSGCRYCGPPPSL